MQQDQTKLFLEEIQQAGSEKTPVRITGGNSKTFYGNPVTGKELNTLAHKGIIEYQPGELVVTVRSGTLVNELEAELRKNGQRLAFEPPAHSSDTTIGGIIATGLSGPGRISAGSARDFVLGARIINGKAEILRFGGQVMKNVAGYDASRLMTGAQGCLGLLLDVSLKVLPIPEKEITLTLPCEADRAINYCRQWLLDGHAISASVHFDHTLYLRLSSTENAVTKSFRVLQDQLGAELNRADNTIWTQIKNQQHAFFRQKNLWRLSLPPGTPTDILPAPQLIEWHGALRWACSKDSLFKLARDYGGHATRYPLYETGEHITTEKDIFQPLSQPLSKLHKRLKNAFDPGRILNPGRLYHEL